MELSRRIFLLLLAMMFVVDPELFPGVRAQDAGVNATEEITDSPWPREVSQDGVKLSIWQPQPEVFEGNRLRVRAAVSVTPKGEEPQFGAVWFESRVKTDREERLVAIEDIQVSDVRFPTAPDDKVENLKAFLSQRLPKWAGARISLDRLMTSLEEAEVKIGEAKNLKNDPPKMLFVQEPTELILVDGEPELRPVESSSLMKVLNSTYIIVLEPKSKLYFVNLDQLWMSAPELKGPWSEAKNPPKEVAALTPKPEPEAEDDGIIPKIIVSTEPMEMIISDGEPKYQVLPDKDLLYMSNTDASVFRELATQDLYALVAGRWFRSKSLEGPWAHVAPDKLPPAFGNIPADSDVGDARAFVAGTQEAKEAVLDAQIPQTLTVKRDVTITVKYDGEPKFEPIKETSMQYAVNTADSVILAKKDGKPIYYCCREGVWYVSASPTGPYAVATEAPPEINEVPPECPVYNTKYVVVYGSTPEVVYVGYTPGYHHCYVYCGTVVYGTGYTYTVWVGTVYYPRPVTYGYAYAYYPRFGGWFTPYSVGGVVRRTRRRTRRRHHAYHHPGHYGPRAEYHRNLASDRHMDRVDHRTDTRQDARDQNVDRRQDAKDQNQDRRQDGAENRQNQSNVCADRDGNVHRRNENGTWEQKGRGGWSASSSKSASSAERTQQSRDRGTTRTNEYNRSSRSSGGFGGGRSGGRSGGGRRG